MVLLDNGHGGMILGKYQTQGKRSPSYSRGVLYEGMFNRWVVNRIKEKLDRLNIPYGTLCPEDRDVDLKTRVNRANSFYNMNGSSWVLSIHANAGGGSGGVEGFTTKGVTRSDYISEVMLRNLQEDLVGQRMRFDLSDGDADKESNYYILRKSKCPAFLLECGFMDVKADYNNLWDEKYLSNLVDSIVRSIIIIENGRL